MLTYLCILCDWHHGGALLWLLFISVFNFQCLIAGFQFGVFLCKHIASQGTVLGTLQCLPLLLVGLNLFGGERLECFNGLFVPLLYQEFVLRVGVLAQVAWVTYLAGIAGLATGGKVEVGVLAYFPLQLFTKSMDL